MNTLSIHTQRAQIEITTRPAKMVIQSNPARFDINRELPKMIIESELPQFVVNDELQPIEPLKAQAKQPAQGVQDAKKPQETGVVSGDTEAVQNDVAVSVTVKDSPEMSVGLKPREKARLEWDPGYCTIEWTDPMLQIEWDSDFMPTVEWEPYAVEVRLRNRPLVMIRVNLEKIPGSVGVRVDQRV